MILMIIFGAFSSLVIALSLFLLFRIVFLLYKTYIKHEMVLIKAKMDWKPSPFFVYTLILFASSMLILGIINAVWHSPFSKEIDLSATFCLFGMLASYLGIALSQDTFLSGSAYYVGFKTFKPEVLSFTFEPEQEFPKLIDPRTKTPIPEILGISNQELCSELLEKHCTKE